MGVSVGVLDHFNIRTRNLADTVRFYEDVLGLEKGARPKGLVVLRRRQSRGVAGESAARRHSCDDTKGWS